MPFAPSTAALLSRLLVAALAVATLASATALPGEQPLPAVPPADLPGAEEMDARPADALGTTAELHAWLDGFVNAQLRDRDIPGAAVAVVDARGPVLLRGFGLADPARGVAVDPQRTGFRIASVTKTFTWTLVMQDVLAGRLDLAADVNRYLDVVEVPARDGRPVTLADLMTHSAGFEERGIGLLAADPEDAGDLEAWLAGQQPALVREPGVLPAYSNYGTALAGHIVARRNAASWEQLVRERLLTPLGMAHTTPQQPLPADFAADFSPGHQRREGRLEPILFQTMHGAPAGAMTATAADLSRWLEALVRGGRVGAEQVLDAALVAKLAEPLRRFAPRVPAFRHGFYGLDRAGAVVFGHHGGLNGTQSLLAVLPEHEIGFFVVFNGFGDPGARGSAVDALLDAFLDRLGASSPEPARSAPEDFEQRAARYVGEYAPTRRNHTTIEKAALLGGTLTVRATDDGHLVTRDLLGRERRWVELAPDAFRSVDGAERLSFSADDGTALRLWSGNQSLGAHERRGGIHAPSTHRTLLTLAALVLLASIVGYPATALRSGERLVFGEVRRLPPAAVTAAWLSAALGLGVLIGIGAALSSPDAFLTGVPLGTRIALWGAAGYALTVLWHLAATASVLLGRDGTRGQRVRLTTVAVANVLLLAILCYWNLMPWGLP